MDLKIPPEEMTKLVSGVVLQMLTPERREAMITEALKKLIESVPSSGYGSPTRSPLQQAFDGAAYQVAMEVTREVMKQPEHVAKIQEVVSKALTQALADDQVVGRMAGLLQSAFAGDLRR